MEERWQADVEKEQAEQLRAELSELRREAGNRGVLAVAVWRVNYRVTPARVPYIWGSEFPRILRMRTPENSPGKNPTQPERRVCGHGPVNIKQVSKSPGMISGSFDFPAFCRKKRSEPPRTRTWNLEIKSLLLCQLS